MTLSNGQDRHATARHGLVPRELNRGQEILFRPRFQPSERPLGWSQLGVHRLPSVRETAHTDEKYIWPVGIGNDFAAHRNEERTSVSARSRQKTTGLVEGCKKICERWSLVNLDIAKLLHLEEEIGYCELIFSGQVRPMAGDLKDRIALVIGISIGLGEFFDDDKSAELNWLHSKRSQLGDVSPLEHLLKGDLLNLRNVIDLLDNVRGLR